MTIKFIGEIKYENGKIIMPSDKNIPPKKEWNHYSIFQFNGKRYNPLTDKAEENIKYAILTTGVEDFIFI